MGGRRRFRRYSSHASPPGFFPASGYLLIGYSKISETRRYRRKKRGDAREKTREPEEEGKRTREVEKEGVERERERENAQVGGLSRTVRERGWGLTTTTPQRRGFLFVPREFLFVSFPVTRPHPLHRQRASIPPLAFATRSPSHPPSPPPPRSTPLPPLLPFPHPPAPTTVHLKYEFDITFHPTAFARPPPRTSSTTRPSFPLS